MNNLGDLLRKIVLYNIRAYKHLMDIFINLPATNDNMVLYQIAKAGFQQNFYLYKNIEDLQFVAADTDSADFENSLMEGFPPAINEERTKVNKEDEGLKKDLEELQKMMSLQDDRKEKTVGETTEIIKPEDWYKRLFGPGGSKE